MIKPSNNDRDSIIERKLLLVDVHIPLRLEWLQTKLRRGRLLRRA
jgi:hypothetical protein